MKIHKALLIIAAILLFLATLTVLSLPYGFFTFLRIVVCAVAIYAAVQESASIPVTMGLLVVAVLFNPFVPIHIPQTTWRIIDLATSVAFIRLAFKPLKTQNQR